MSSTASAGSGKMRFCFINSVKCLTTGRTELFTLWRYFWEIVMMIIYGMSFILIPYNVAFCYGQQRLQPISAVSVVISLIGKDSKGTKIIFYRRIMTCWDFQISFAWWTLQLISAQAIKIIVQSESYWKDDRLRAITCALTFGSISLAHFQIVSCYHG